MTMNSVAERLKKEYEGIHQDRGIANNDMLSYEEMWFWVKFAKGVRRYCRTNTAFNNFCNQIFGRDFKFEQVTKRKPSGEEYPGLQITMKNLNGTEYVDNDMEGEGYEP